MDIHTNIMNRVVIILYEGETEHVQCTLVVAAGPDLKGPLDC